MIIGKSLRAGWRAVAFVVCASSSVLGQDPGEIAAPSPASQRPGFVLVDDMLLPEDALAGDSTFLATPWPGGNVYVEFSIFLSESERNWVRRAFAEIEAVCGADFFEVDGSFTGDHVLIGPNPGFPNVGHSDVGVVGGQQELVLGTSFFDADSKYGIVHELMHTLGFKHEHQRPDRFLFVTILTNNISQTACNGSACDGNFTILGGATTTIGPYDFQSIMHYRATAFSVGETNTIVANPGFQQFQSQMGNRAFFSQGDADGLQSMYGQPSPPQVTSIAPTSVQAGTVLQFTILVNGQNFFEGSLVPDLGITGTKVRFNGQELETGFNDEDQVVAVIPGDLLDVPGQYPVDVIQHSEAGGVSTTSATFTVLPPPCASTTDRVGHAVVGLGDVTGDGRDDYAVGVPGHGSDSGRILVYSGGTGAAVWNLNGYTSSMAGFALAAMDDINGDGARELLVGFPNYQSNAGRMQIRSGANGAILTDLINGTAGQQWGYALTAIGDADGDGDQDFAVGKPSANNNTGEVQVWSTNGGLMRTHVGGVAGDFFGRSLGGGYDVNQDGYPDYVVGAPEKIIGGLSSVGRVYVYSGLTGSLIVTKDGDGVYDRFGYDVALVPTTGAAGPYGNILVGAPEIPNFFSGSGNGPGYVRLFNHNSLLNAYATLVTWTGSAVGDRYGISVGSAGDVDDDGHPDIVIGYPQSLPLMAPTGPGGFDIRSGKSPYGWLYRHFGTPLDEQLGFSVDGCGDVNGDGRLEVIAGSPGSDLGCIDAGAFAVVHVPVPPERRKVMITEISSGNPDCVEITNFGTAAVSLSGWKLRWKDGSVTEASLSLTLSPGASMVVSETTALAEMPAGTPFHTLPPVGTSLGDLAVALVNNRGVTVDEVHVQDAAGAYTEGSLGGRFRGTVAQPATGVGVVAQRIWGLDSNAGRDFTTGGARSMGLQNLCVGSRGSDPLPITALRITEIDDNPDYVELYRPGSVASFAPPVNLAGWSLLASSGQNVDHARILPFPGSFFVGTGAYVVVGDGAATPPELPSGGAYVNLALIQGGNLPWVAGELDCALYDSFGRLVDVVRATAQDVAVAHNHPRAPAHPADFSGAAARTSAGDGALGRNSANADTNTGADFQPIAARTMGAANAGAVFTPTGEPELSVVLNDGLGGGFTAIIDAGRDRAGQRWSFAFSLGHQNGLGPIAGLGSDVVSNWLAYGSTAPFFGFLDGYGTARLDVPAGTLGPGVTADFVFVLQDGLLQTAPITVLSAILEFDT